ncbi:MAG: hypothetical protein ACREXS_11155 [Gammaproteobacteria bacterium]
MDTFDPATRYTYNRDQQLDLITRPDGQVLDFVMTAPDGCKPSPPRTATPVINTTAPGACKASRRRAVLPSATATMAPW